MLTAIETKTGPQTFGGGKAHSTWDGVLFVIDGYASHPGGRLAKGVAPLGADHVELRSDRSLIMRTTLHRTPEVDGAFFIVPVPEDAPPVREAIAYAADGTELARRRVEPLPSHPT